MEERRCAVRVRGAGMLHALPDGFVDGFCVSVETRLGEVVDPSKIRLVAYAREREVRDCRAGTRVACLEAGAVRRISGTVRSVTAVSALPEAEIALCSVGGGPLPAEEEGGRIHLLEACYRLEIEPDPGAALHPGRSGTVRLFTESKSLLVEYARFAWSVLVRESGF